MRCLFDRADAIERHPGPRDQAAPRLDLQARQRQIPLAAARGQPFRDKRNIGVDVGLRQFVLVIGHAPAAAGTDGRGRPAVAAPQFVHQVEHQVQRRADGRRVEKLRPLVKVQPGHGQALRLRQRHRFDAFRRR